MITRKENIKSVQNRLSRFFLFFLFSLSGIFPLHSVEFEVLDKFSVNGTSVFKSTSAFQGKVGIGTSSPRAALDVSGGIKLGTAAVCDANTEGTLRYGDGNFDICRSNVWNSLASTSVWSGSGGSLFLEGGSVAIGTNTANEKLTVDGFLSVKSYPPGTAPSSAPGYGKLFSIEGTGGNDTYAKLLLHFDGGNGSASFADSSPSARTVSSDGYDSYTKLLLHMNGSNGSTIFTDSTGKTATAANHAKISTGNYKFGGAAGQFDGVDDYIYLADSNDWAYNSTDDFTIDGWARLDDVSASSSFLGQSQDASNWFSMGYSSSYNLYYTFYNGMNNGGNHTTVSGYVPPVQQWFHFALVKYGSSIKFYINGDAKISKTWSGNFNVSGNLMIGYSDYITNNASPASMRGYLDEIRISKGIARWTGNFTPPSLEYGKVMVSSAQSRFGGTSAQFSGLGEYLSAVDSPDFSFGTGSFTVDEWVFVTDLSANRTIWSQGTDAWNAELFRITAAGAVDFNHFISNNAVISLSSSDGTVSANQWYHLALVRNGNSWNIYKNGSVAASTTNYTACSDWTGPFAVGIYNYGTGTQNPFAGYMDEFRISNGTARWTTGFTPPSGPYDSGGAVYYKDDMGNVTSLTGSGGGAASGQWAQNGQDIYYSAGGVGIGTSNPGSNLDVLSSTFSAFMISAGTGTGFGFSVSTGGNLYAAGSIRAGNDISACSAANAGALRFDGSHFYGCNGFSWRQLDNSPAPVITSVLPSSGPALGGTTITITGTGFSPGAEITLGNIFATGVTVLSGSTVTAVTEASSTVGKKDIKLTNTDGQYASLAEGFEYLADGSSQAMALPSCKTIKDIYKNAPDGIYWIDPNGGPTSDAYQSYCDMTTAGGGWTLIFQRRGGPYLSQESCGANLNSFLWNTCGSISSLSYGSSYSMNLSNIPAHNEYQFSQFDSGMVRDNVNAYIISYSGNLFPNSTGSINNIPVSAICDINNQNCDTTDTYFKYAGTGYYSETNCNSGWSDDGFGGNYGYCQNGISTAYWSNDLFGQRGYYMETKLWGHNYGHQDWMERVFVR